MTDERKTIFDYISQFMAIYGGMVIIFMVWDYFIGEHAKGYSSLFAMGGQGFTLSTLLQLLVLALVITVAQVVFMSDAVITKLGRFGRYLGFFVIIVIAIVIFSICFQWFPVGDFRSWCGFIVSFVICTAVSIAISMAQERAENRKMNNALQKMMEEDE